MTDFGYFDAHLARVPFIAQINAVAFLPDGVTYTYGFAEQTWNGDTGQYEIADAGRTGDVVNGPYLIETNNGFVPLGVYVQAYLRNPFDGTTAFEFQAPAFPSTCVALTQEDIPAGYGSCPGSGLVQTHALNVATGCMSDIPLFNVTAYNLDCNSVASNTWIQLYLEPNSLTWFVGHVYCAQSSSSSSSSAACVGCYINGGEPDELVITDNTVAPNGLQAASIQFLPEPNTPPTTITVYFTISSTVSWKELQIGWRWNCPPSDGIAVQLTPSLITLYTTLSGILDQQSGSESSPSTADCYFVITDDGVHVTVAFYLNGVLTASLAGSSTDSISNPGYVSIYMDGLGIALTGIQIQNESEVTWLDSFEDANGTLLRSHTPIIGCGETDTNWYCMQEPSSSSSSSGGQQNFGLEGGVGNILLEGATGTIITE